MNGELKIKFQQLIESNFAKAESEALVRLVNEHEQLKQETANQAILIMDLKEELAEKKKDLKDARDEIGKLIKDIDGLKADNTKFRTAHDEMKEKFVTLKLEATEKSLEQIFRLTEVAFKNPSKVRRFDMPVTNEYTNHTNGACTSKNTTTIPVKETISEE